MIDLIFYFGTEIIFIRVSGNDIRFASSMNPNAYSDISGLKLDYVGVCREFPDLETSDNWKEEAIGRFKEKIRGFETEDQKANYIIEDLKKHGYIPKVKKKAGFRQEQIE